MLCELRRHDKFNTSTDDYHDIHMTLKNKFIHMSQINFKSGFLLTALIFSALAILNSCGERTPLMPNVTGRAGEVVVVINSPVWESDAGRQLNRVLSTEFPALPQAEPMFDVRQIGHGSFSNIFKTHRNIVIVSVSGQYSQSQMNIRRNVYAKPQVFLEIVSPDVEALESFVASQHERIIEELNKAELERIKEYNSRYERSAIRSQLDQSFNLSIVFPPGYSVYLDTTDFAWINFSPPTQERIQGVFVYQYEYTDPETFTTEYMINKRNEFLRQYVPGNVVGSFMTTETAVLPLFNEFMENGRYFAEMRGLWKLENGFMGGPFVSLTTLDEDRNRVITVEGFVFAPEERKRNLLRQVEGIINTLNIREAI